MSGTRQSVDPQALSLPQSELLAAIRRRVHGGEPVPSYRELCSEFGWSSTGTVRDHLRALARKGYVELSGQHHRRIKLLGDRLAVAAVPLVGRVAAGLPIMAIENIERTIPVPAEWTDRGVYFGLRVAGESMIDAGISDGDVVIVRQQNTGANGDIVVVTLDGDTTVKRLEIRGAQTILQPANRRFRPIAVRTESAQVQGVIVGLLRTYGLRHIAPLPRSRVERTQTKRRRRAEG